MLKFTSNNINLFEPNGQFGCIDPETPVLLWNGNIEKAKNIKVGDELVGDDGTCRIVSRLTQGIDEMYEVSNGNLETEKEELSSQLEKLSKEPADKPVTTNKFAEKKELSKVDYKKLSRQEKYWYNINNKK